MLFYLYQMIIHETQHPLFFFILRQRDKARDNTKNATSRKKKFSHEIVFYFFYFSCAKYDPTNETIVSVGYFFRCCNIVPRSLSTEVIILNFGMLNQKKVQNKRKNFSLTDVSFLLRGFYSIVSYTGSISTEPFVECNRHSWNVTPVLRYESQILFQLTFSTSKNSTRPLN